MSTIIESYYKEANIMPLLMKQKLDKFQRNKDIASEFEYWITNKKYLENNCVLEQGYTAKKIAEISSLLDGEAAFLLLIELREEPEKGLKRIRSGFKLK